MLYYLKKHDEVSMYLLLLAIIYLAFISLGLPDSTLGAAWPTIYEEFNIPISYMGIVSVTISVGTIISSLFTDRAVAKLGTRGVTAASIFLTALSLFGFSISTEFYQICLWAIPYGFGAGAIDASLNNYIALHYNSRHMNWLHCFWGVGTVISPYVMSFALSNSGWQMGYRLLSVIQIAIAVIVLLSFPLWKVNKKGGGSETEVKPVGIVGALKIPGAAAVFTGFFAYCASESTAMLWTSSYFEEVFKVSKTEAATLGSIFFIGMTVGRFISGLISEKIGDGKMIRYGALVSMVGILVICIPVKEVAIIGFIIFGLGCAPVYPSIVHSTPERFGSERSQSIIGIQMAAAYLGSIVMPSIFGIIANFVTISLMPLYLGIFVVIMLYMIIEADKITLNK